MLGRIAGDEFVCLLKDHTRTDAEALGELAYARVTSFRLEVRPDQYAAVGLGFGVAESSTDGQSIDELLHAAAVATRMTSVSCRTDAAVLSTRTVPPAYSQSGKSGPLQLVR